MVQAADLWNGDDRAEHGRRDQPSVRRVFRQREMCPRSVVVREVATQDASQSGFIQHDYVIKTLASDGADDSLRIRVGVSRRLHHQRVVDHKPFASRIRSIRCTGAFSN